MEDKFTPGQMHIVEEITSRFLEKERVNTSLLHFLHEQEVPCEAQPHFTLSNVREHVNNPPVDLCCFSRS